MACWCYSVVLLVLVGSASSVHVDPYDEFEPKFEHDDNMDRDRVRDEDPLPATLPGFAATRTTLSVTISLIQCYSCSSLDDETCKRPAKTITNVTTCSAEGSRCFTTTTETLVKRGCQDNCVVDNSTTCCEQDFCNNKAVSSVKTDMTRRSDQQKNKSDKPLPQTVLFFVTVLLLLQTVVKVALV